MYRLSNTYISLKKFLRLDTARELTWREVSQSKAPQVGWRKREEITSKGANEFKSLLAKSLAEIKSKWICSHKRNV